MAKKQEKTSRRSGGKTEPAVGAKGHTAGAVPSRRKMMAGRKGLRRRLHKLEGQLADAARQERKRLRRLERALWRRQRIEAAIDEIKTATALVKNAAAAEAAKPAEAKPVVAKPVAKNAAAKPAARRPAARSAAAKPVATRRAAAKPAAPASTQEVTTVTAETPAPSAPPRPVRTRRAPVKRVAQPRSNGAAASPRPPIEAEPAPVPPTQS